MLQDLPEVLEIEVSPEGQWKPSSGRYSWTDITDKLLPPLPEPIEVIANLSLITLHTSII